MDPQQDPNSPVSPPEPNNPYAADDIIARPDPSFTPRTSGGSFRGNNIAPITPGLTLKEETPVPPVSSEAVGVIPPQQSVPSWTPQAAASGQPVAAGGPVPANTATPPPAGQPNKKLKKKILIGAGAGLVVIALALGTVFGYYLPNKPENVYKTGMSRSGKAIDKLVDQATEKEKLQQIKKSEFDGSLEISSNTGGSFSGTFNVKVDPTKSDGRLEVKIDDPDQPDQEFGLKFLTELQKDKRFPDLYFQLSGLKTLGVDAFVPGVSDYDGKWIAVEAEYLESLSSGFIPPDEKKNKENVSSEEVAGLIRVVSDVSNEYLFTADPDKAVLENREYLGKEKTEEGINAFHYKVGINAKNSVAYCKALSEKVLSQPVIKKIANADDKEIEEYKKSAIKDCDNSAKDIKSDDTFEMWIDAKYKVIHKVRFYAEKDKKDAYTDVGQIYTGDDKLALFTKYHQDKDNLNVKFTLDVDIKGNNSKAELSAKQEGDSGFSGKARLSAKPYSGEINTSKPPGAIPIKDILARFGFDPTYQSGIQPGNPVSPPGSVQSKAKDSERKADINALYSQVEVYYADNGFYPSLEELNSKSFRSANMKSLDNAALTPPDSSQSTLAGVPSASMYGYAASNCKGSKNNQCQKYTLSALLSTGQEYTKSSLAP